MAWLLNWNLRKQLYLSGTSVGSQSNYQMKLTIYYGNGTDSAGNIYCNSQCKTDFSDIRFTDSTGNTLLNYWIESYTASSSATVWIKIPSIPTGTNSAYIYFYYNNPSPPNDGYNSGANTFLFYDNFTEFTTGQYAPFGPWSKDPNAYDTQIVNNGKLMPRFGLNDTYQRSGITAYSHSYNSGISLDGKMYLVSPVYSGCSFFVSPLTGGTVYGSSNNFVSAKFSTGCNYDIMSIKIQTSVNGTQYTYTLSTTVSTNTWYNFRVATYNLTVYVKMWQVGTTEPSAWTFTQSIPAGQWPTITGPIELFSYNMQPYADIIRIRNFVVAEPTWSSNIGTVQGSIQLNISSTPIGGEIWLAFPSGSAWVDQHVQTNTTIYPTQGTGYYDVEIGLGGYQPWTLYNQYYVAGQVYNISATLIELPGSLSISSTPEGAEIYLSLSPGIPADQGTTTIIGGRTISNLSPGTYNIRLTLSGYQDWSGTANVTSNNTTSMNATFAGSANITSTPSGAEIYLAIYPGTPNDQTVITPKIMTGLTSATSGATTVWNYRLTTSGYADATGSFTATAGTTINVPITFPGSLSISSIPEGASIYIDDILQ